MKISWKHYRGIWFEPLEDYLEFCEERNEEPEKPFSRKFNLRISPELPRKIYVAARQKGLSINSLVCNILGHSV
jgi:predicted HicB family RNase H-like nuclease